MSETPPISWQHVVDSIALPISVHDRNHVVRLANAAFCRALGRTEDQIIGHHCHEMVHCSDMPLAACPHSELLASGKPVEREIVSVDETHVVGISCFPLRDGQGEILGSVHMVRDVTAVAQLRQHWDRRSRNIAGYLRVLGAFLQAPDRFSTHKGIPFQNENLQPCHKVKGCEKVDCPSRQREDVRCWHGFCQDCQNAGSDDPADRLALCHQCDVYKRATPDDLSSLTELFNDFVYLLQLKQAEVIRSERLAVVGTLSSKLAHDLRTPLNSLAIQVQRMGRRLQREEAPNVQELKDLQTSVVAEVWRLDEAIRGFSLEARRPGGDRDRPLNALVDEVCGAQQGRAQQMGIRMSVVCDCPDLLLPGALLESLRIVMTNLGLNALEAVRPGDCIEARVEHDGHRILVSYSDTGPGVPDSQKARIFDAFFSTKPNGTGLGLALVDHVVRQAQGHVVYAENPGGGAIFTVTVPLGGEGRK